MFLVLLRHGIAQPKNLGIDDDKRKLTQEGIEEFTQFMPFLIPRLSELSGTEHEPVIWSSPLVRARQTAQILAGQTGWLLDQDVKSLADGNFKAFLDLLENSETETAIILVGHEPHLSEWTLNLTGGSQTYKKGAAAAIELEAGSDKPDGRLAWYLAPGEAAPVSGEDFLQALFRRALRAVEKAETDYLGDPEAPETVHQLRVKTRTLRSLLSFYKPLLKESVCEDVQDQLRQSGLELARLRELDVLDELCAEQNCEASSFRHFLTQERETENTRVYGLLSRGGGEEQRAGFVRMLDELPLSKQGKKLLSKSESVSINDKLMKFTQKRLDDWMDKIREERKKLDMHDISAVHRLRIRAKKARYVQESLSDRLPAEREQSSKVMKELQTLLGALCDAGRSRQAVTDMLPGIEGEDAKREARDYIRVMQQAEKDLADGLKLHLPDKSN